MMKVSSYQKKQNQDLLRDVCHHEVGRYHFGIRMRMENLYEGILDLVPMRLQFNIVHWGTCLILCQVQHHFHTRNTSALTLNFPLQTFLEVAYHLDPIKEAEAVFLLDLIKVFINQLNIVFLLFFLLQIWEN